MAQLLEIHPTHPQSRMIRMVVAALEATSGTVIVYPTDTAYALGCRMGDKEALSKIIALRQLPKNHQFTIACRDLKSLGTYARVDNAGYRLLKKATPGPFTFVMQATRDVPRRVLHPKRRTIGLRVPDQPVALALLAQLGEPLLTTTVRFPDTHEPLSSAYEIYERIGKQVSLVLDIGQELRGVSTVVDLTESPPVTLREGIGDLDGLFG